MSIITYFKGIITYLKSHYLVKCDYCGIILIDLSKNSKGSGVNWCGICDPEKYSQGRYKGK